MASEEELANLQRLSNDAVFDLEVKRLGGKELIQRLIIYRDRLLGRANQAEP
jgi:hypothetical protein